jgi:hypothetical protein
MNTFSLLPEFSSDQLPLVLDVQVSTTLNLSAEDARRYVNHQVIPQLGTGLVARTPELSIANTQITWRVPIELSLPHLGNLGEVGVVQVDAHSGEVVISVAEQEQIITHARRLYRGATLPTE